MRARYSAKRPQSLESWAATPTAARKRLPKATPHIIPPRSKPWTAGTANAERLVYNLQEQVAALEERVEQAHENFRRVENELAETAAAFATLGQQITVLEIEIAEMKKRLGKLSWPRFALQQTLIASMVGGAIGVLAQLFFL